MRGNSKYAYDRASIKLALAIFTQNRWITAWDDEYFIAIKKAGYIFRTRICEDDFDTLMDLVLDLLEELILLHENGFTAEVLDRIKADVAEKYDEKIREYAIGKELCSPKNIRKIIKRMLYVRGVHRGIYKDADMMLMMAHSYIVFEHIIADVEDYERYFGYYEGAMYLLREVVLLDSQKEEDKGSNL